MKTPIRFIEIEPVDCNRVRIVFHRWFYVSKGYGEWRSKSGNPPQWLTDGELWQNTSSEDQYAWYDSPDAYWVTYRPLPIEREYIRPYAVLGKLLMHKPAFINQVHPINVQEIPGKLFMSCL